MNTASPGADGATVLPPGGPDAGPAAEPSLQELIDLYVAGLRRLNYSKKQVGRAKSLLPGLVKACRWKSLADVAAGRASFDAWYNALPGKTKTVKNKLSTVSAWLGWLYETSRIKENWAKRVRAPRVTDQEQKPALTDDEFDAVIAAALADEALPTWGKSGRRPPGFRRHDYTRSPLYEWARWTGLRDNEIRCLRRGWLKVGAASPRVVIPADVAKSRKEQMVPLVGRALELARGWAAGDPDELVFKKWPHYEVLQHDFQEAGIPEKCGWHAFRRTMITGVVLAGADMNTTQQLARHSDPRLTSKYYIDKKLLPLAQALTDCADRVQAGRDAKNPRSHLTDPERDDDDDGAATTNDSPNGPTRPDDPPPAETGGSSTSYGSRQRVAGPPMVRQHPRQPSGSAPGSPQVRRHGGFESLLAHFLSDPDVSEAAASLLAALARRLREGASDGSE